MPLSVLHYLEATQQEHIDDLIALIKAEKVIIDVDIRMGHIKFSDGLMGLEVLLDQMMYDYLNSLSKEDIELAVMQGKMGLKEWKAIH